MRKWLGWSVCIGHCLMAPAWSSAQSISPAEGPLQNDTFVPIHKGAAGLLLKGDTDLLNARRQQNQTHLASALDAWQLALRQSSPTDWVHGSDPGGVAAKLWTAARGGPGRLEFGVQAAVAHRLMQLEPSEQSAWVDRFGPLAKDALERSPFDAEGLKRLEYRFPLTRAASHAALRLADLELERGAHARAQTWLDRAAWHQHLTGSNATWTDHLKARGWQSHGPQERPTPKNLSDLKLVRAVRLEARPGRLPQGETPTLGLGLIPGLAAMDDGSIVVQTPRTVIHLSAAYLDGEAGNAQVQGLASITQEGPLRPLTPSSSGGWPLMPLTRGSEVFLVVDRARSGSIRYGLPIPSRSNHLICLQAAADGELEVVWRRSSDGLFDAEGTLLGDLEPRGAWEFQPGPILVDDLLICVARAMPEPTVAGEEGDERARGGPGEAFLNLMAFHAGDGSLAYSVPFAKASDLVLRDASSVSQGIPTVCMPLAFDPNSGQVLVASHHGLITTFDATDGRARWSLRTRRRNPRERGWPGSRRPSISELTAWVAPFDSDFLYTLDLRRQALSPLKEDPTPKGLRLDLVHADTTGKAFLGRRGRHETLWYEPKAGAAQYSAFLGRQEHLTGTLARTRDAWLFASTRGLYVLDPAREWAFTHHYPLQDQGAGIGGNVYTLGDRVLVLGEDTLWVLH